MLDINKTVESGKATFALAGRLDTVTAPVLEKALQETLPDIDELVLDFGQLEYISSAGLRVLLSSQKIMSRKGGMKLVGVNETVREIFEVTGFLDILTIE